MTGVADRHRMMAALGPGIVVVLHDMTVRADLRVVAHIREPFGIDERVRAHAHAGSCHGAQEHCRPGKYPPIHGPLQPA